MTGVRRLLAWLSAHLLDIFPPELHGLDSFDPPAPSIATDWPPADYDDLARRW